MPVEGQVVVLSRTGVEGRVDAVTDDTVFGWAWDRRDRDRRLAVEIWLGKRLLGKCQADQERADLTENGIGDGRYAFEFRLTEPLPTSGRDDLRVLAIPGDGGEAVPLAMPSPAEIAAENVLAPPLTRMAKAIDTLAAAYRQTAVAQRSGLRALEDRLQKDTDNDAVRQAAVAREETASALAALEKRLGELEVFALRFDETLHSIDRRLAERPSATDRPLRGMVAGLGVLIAAAIGLAVYAALGGGF